MSVVSTEQVSGALAKVVIPNLDKSLLDLDVIQEVSVRDGDVKLMLRFNIPAYASKSQLRGWVTEAVEALPGVTSVQTEFVSGSTAGPQAGTSEAQPHGWQIPLTQIGCVLAIFSGKGGVGKSTVSANLAVALSARGEQVGLFDADMHGPSIPRIMGISERPSMGGHQMKPLERHGVKTMSVGFLVEEDEPLIWRGPMITKGINEMLGSTDWGALDILILDLPPGTGDAQLGIAQDVRLDGTIAVTTPQDVALSDVWRGIAAFNKLEVPIWGVIENMAYFVCPGCGTTAEIFGKGGGERASQRQEIPLLGRLPLDPAVCQSADDGVPLVTQQPKHPASVAIIEIADQILKLMA